jgi:hypothetical protein
MTAFDFPSLVWWGLPLAAVPLFIHLINLLRHRRVPFAAIEFLLASQRKYRTRVLLRQLILLALRTAAVVGLVLMLAQPRWRTALGSFFGGGRAVHVVVLDDSASMRDRSSGGGLGDTTAYDRGRAAAARIVADLAAAARPAQVAVARSSALAARTPAPSQDPQSAGRDDGGRDVLPAATRVPEETAPAGAGSDAAVPPERDRRGADDPGGSFDLPLQAATPATAGRVADELDRRPASFRATNPAVAIDAALPILTAGSGTERVLWLVSDFRTRDWGVASDVAAATRRLAEAGVTVRFIDCGATTEAVAGNLTVERLEVVGGVPAAGVLVPLEVSVRNDGVREVQDVTIVLREDGSSRPGARLAAIPPGGAASARFDVRFAAAGSHLVEAELPSDVLDADNARVAVVDVAERAAVLVIDGDPRGDGRTGDAFHVATALAPGAGAATGVLPRVESPRALATLDLDGFDSIWLLDVPRLDPPEIAALEAYARDGGGVVFFTGPRTQADAVNRLLHRGGEGVFPLALAGPVDLPGKAASDPVPDIVVEDHPVVAVLAGRRNPLLDAVRVDRVMAAAPLAANAEADGGIRRLLSLRTGAPLVVEREYGRGTVVAVLSTAAPTWNNWSRGNPSWVVVLLELEGHLARGRRRGAEWIVGEPAAIRIDDATDGTEVDVTTPPDGQVIRLTAIAAAAGRTEILLPPTESPGAYAARWIGLDGDDHERTIAVNVDPREGRLERVGREGLAAALPGVAFTLESAAALGGEPDRAGGLPLMRPLLALLAAVLVAEQLLALVAGYHPVAPRSARRAARPA